MEQGLFVEDYDHNKNIYKLGNIKTRDFAPEEIQKLAADYTKKINESLKERNPELYAIKYKKTADKEPLVAVEN